MGTSIRQTTVEALTERGRFTACQLQEGLTSSTTSIQLTEGGVTRPLSKTRRGTSMAPRRKEEHWAVELFSKSRLAVASPHSTTSQIIVRANRMDVFPRAA